jgi:hypothetical protein
MDLDHHAFVTGGDPNIILEHRIAVGSSAEVYKVSPLEALGADSSCHMPGIQRHFIC